MLQPGRRDLLRAIVGTAILTPLAGCDLLDFGRPPERPDSLTGMYIETLALAALYGTAAEPNQVAIRDAHRVHAEALGAIMRPSPSPSAAAAPAVPADPDQLKQQEQAAWKTARDACLLAPQERVVLLGEITAARATHLEALGTKPRKEDEQSLPATPSAAPTAPAIADPERLRAALAAEHAALFAYGRLGVLLEEKHKDLAKSAEAAHKARRDTLVVELAGLKVAAVPAEISYTLPFPVTDNASAIKLALHVEEGVTATWRAALWAVSGQWRFTTLDAYSDTAVRATRWRKLAGVTPVTSQFPGRVA